MENLGSVCRCIFHHGQVEMEWLPLLAQDLDMQPIHSVCQWLPNFVWNNLKPTKKFDKSATNNFLSWSSWEWVAELQIINSLFFFLCWHYLVFKSLISFASCVGKDWEKLWSEDQMTPVLPRIRERTLFVKNTGSSICQLGFGSHAVLGKPGWSSRWVSEGQGSRAQVVRSETF